MTMFLMCNGWASGALLGVGLIRAIASSYRARQGNCIADSGAVLTGNTGDNLPDRGRGCES